MVFFVSFVEKRTYPLQHPLQKATCEFLGRIYFGWAFFILLTPPHPPTSEQNLCEMPSRIKQNRGSQEKKEKKKGGGKKQSTAAQRSASVKL